MLLGTLTEITIANRLLAPSRCIRSAKANCTKGNLFEYTLTKNKKGILHLAWKINAQKLNRAKGREDVCVLKANLPVKPCPTAKASSTCEEQSRVERRFHHCKGPMTVAPSS